MAPAIAESISSHSFPTLAACGPLQTNDVETPPMATPVVHPDRDTCLPPLFTRPQHQKSTANVAHAAHIPASNITSPVSCFTKEGTEGSSLLDSCNSKAACTSAHAVEAVQAPQFPFKTHTPGNQSRPKFGSKITSPQAIPRPRNSALPRGASPPSTPQPSKQVCIARVTNPEAMSSSLSPGDDGGLLLSASPSSSVPSSSPPFTPSTPTIHRQPQHTPSHSARANCSQPCQHPSDQVPIEPLSWSGGNQRGRNESNARQNCRRRELFTHSQESYSSPRQLASIRGFHIPKSPSSTCSSRRRLSLRHGSKAGEMAQYVRYLADAMWKREREMGLGGWLQCTVDFEECYKVVGDVGRGHFGVVRLCEEKGTGLRFACKTIPKAKIQKEEDLEELCSEVTTMLKLQSHPGIPGSRFVQLYEVMNDSESIHLIIEYCDGGDFFEYLANSKRLSEEETAEMLREVVLAVRDLHSLGFVHRDVKLENILLCNPNLQQSCANTIQQDPQRQRPKWIVKLSDFGLCITLKPGQMAKGAAGSPFYMAPEVVSRKLYGREVDVWGLGVILYTCLSGYLPFWGKDKASVFGCVLAAKPNLEKKPWPSISAKSKELIKGMLDPDPRRRLGLDEVLEHPWLTKLP